MNNGIRFGAIAAAVLLSGCGLNSIPTADEEVKARWADVENYYQRRADLIPNLVATVKASGAQEKDILVQVTQARAAANTIRVTSEDLSDPAKLAQFDRAQSSLGFSLQKLQEAYPDLKSQANFTTLLGQLEGTENRITIARRDYNASVQKYNTTIRTFPAAITASIVYGAKPKAPFAATTPGAEAAPKVDFGN
jgi:LemA protein